MTRKTAAHSAEETIKEASPVSDEHDNHGQTPAAWTAVIIIMIAFVIGTVAVVIANWPLFWIGGVALGLIGAIVGKVMSMMGMGATPKTGA